MINAIGLMTKSINTQGLGVYKWIRPASFENVKLQSCLTKDTLELQSPHLDKDFVQSLTKLKAVTDYHKLKKIKNAILEKMGYDSPRSLKIELDFSETGCDMASLNPHYLEINFGEKLLKAPIEEQIVFLYHELDHFDKFAKVYKCLGKKYFNKLLQIATKNPDCEQVDPRPYRRMTQHIDISDFDINKWYKAIMEYSSGKSHKYSEIYKYLNNPLEQSAVNTHVKIQKILGLPVKRPQDRFPENYLSMVNSFNKQGITNPNEQDEIISTAFGFATLKQEGKDVIKTCHKLQQGLDCTIEEFIKFQNASIKIAQEGDTKSNKALQEIYKEVEDCINHGAFTVDDILAFMAK